jgi:uncharacterized phiE125 gp8 family phage protein
MNTYIVDDYNITILEAPSEEPVTPAELHAHLSLNVDLAAVEDLLSVYITAAREQFEFETDWRTVLPTTFQQHIRYTDEDVKLYRGNVLSVDAITYYDTDDIPQTLNGWVVDSTGTPAVVSMPSGWPSFSATRARPFTIEFTAGWATVADVPQSVRLPILLLAGHYYNVREAFSEVSYGEVPMGFKAMCAKWRTGLGGI